MKKISKKNSVSKEMYKAIPEEIKIAFGKFYIFSFIYLLFFLIIYPFFLINNVNNLFSFIILIFLILFYIYMIIDTRMRVKRFVSNLYYLLILFVFFSISFSVVKFFI
jgi:CDP-diglyceride synthetase